MQTTLSRHHRWYPAASSKSFLLAQVLTAQLLFHKPSDPRAFCIDFVQKLQKQQSGTDLLNKQDVETMFSMFDITNQGMLSKQQAFRAVKTVLGPGHAAVKARSEDCGSPEMMDKHKFVRYVMDAIQGSAGAATAAS